MKNFYKKFLNFLFNIPLKVENCKTIFFEWYAILRKKTLYKNVTWTKEQQKEFDEFWKNSYGKKISNRWHRLYQSMNGIYKIDYIPELLYTTKIENKNNDYYYSKVLSDKSLLGVIFNNKIPNVRTPKTYIINSFGVFYNSEREIISEKDAIQILENIGEAVIKPTVDSSSGKNIKILDLHNGINIKDDVSIKELLSSYSSNYIVQEKIQPHPDLKKIYPNAINTLRVISYVLNSKVYVAPISLRIGSGGNAVDNIHAGGMVIGVSNTGELNNKAYRLGYGDTTEIFYEHPDTKVIFKEVKLDFIKELIEVAKKLHGLTSNIGIISWDFTIDADGNFVIIEVNLKGQSVWFPQMISGQPLLGENTREYLSSLNATNR